MIEIQLFYTLCYPRIYEVLPIEFLHWATDFQFGPLKNCGLTPDFEPHGVLIGVGLFIDLVDVGFNHRITRSFFDWKRRNKYLVKDTRSRSASENRYLRCGRIFNTTRHYLTVLTPQWQLRLPYSVITTISTNTSILRCYTVV